MIFRSQGDAVAAGLSLQRCVHLAVTISVVVAEGRCCFAPVPCVPSLCPSQLLWLWYGTKAAVRPVHVSSLRLPHLLLLRDSGCCDLAFVKSASAVD